MSVIARTSGSEIPGALFVFPVSVTNLRDLSVILSITGKGENDEDN